jgi:hypothetical protein
MFPVFVAILLICNKLALFSKIKLALTSIVILFSTVKVCDELKVTIAGLFTVIDLAVKFPNEE